MQNQGVADLEVLRVKLEGLERRLTQVETRVNELADPRWRGELLRELGGISARLIFVEDKTRSAEDTGRHEIDRLKQALLEHDKNSLRARHQDKEANFERARTLMRSVALLLLGAAVSFAVSQIAKSCNEPTRSGGAVAGYVSPR